MLATAATTTIQTFAPGKLILIGDHSSVLGGVGVVTPLSQGVELELKPGSGQITVEHRFDTSATAEIEDFVDFIIMSLQKQTLQPQLAAFSLQAFDLHVKLDIPIRSGLGSSTAITSALAQAMDAVLQVSLSDQQLFLVVKDIESQQYPVSGLDQAAVVFQKTLEMSRPNGQLIWKPLITPNQSEKRVVLIQSGLAEESTAEMVGVFKKNADLFPQKVARMQELAAKASQSLQAGDWPASDFQEFGQLMIEMGVVGQKAQAIQQQLAQAGSISKVTAGGGFKAGSGMIMAWQSDLQKVISLARKKSWDFIEVSF